MFDYGVDETQIGGKISNIKVWPTEGERTALLDADAIAYVIGYTSDMQQYLTAKRSPTFLESRVFADKKEHANFIINKWVTDAGCDSAMLYLTDGESNFRNKIAKQKAYKGQRLFDKPPFFYEIRDWLMKFQGALVSRYCEADDEISIEAWKRHAALAAEGVELWTAFHKKLCNFVIVSGDKDLSIIPGSHCPPNGKLVWIEPLGELQPEWREKDVIAYEYWPLFDGELINLAHCAVPMRYAGNLVIKKLPELRSPKLKWEMDYVWMCDGAKQDTYSRGKNKDKGKFKRVKVGTKKSEYLHKLRGTGLKFFYSQLITGDTVDNYSGLPDHGPVTALDLLDDAVDEQDLVSRVRQAYEGFHGDAWLIRLTEQGQLAHMQTYTGELWQLPGEGESTFPL